MENIKTCTKCKLQKDLTLFHLSKFNKIGRRPTCKECDANEQRKRMLIKLSDKDNLEKRRKYAREWSRNNKKSLTEDQKRKCALNCRNWAKKYPEKVSAGFSIMHFKVETGFHKHHWSYNRVHWRDIIILTEKSHKKAHRFLVYDQEQMMYRRFDNNVLLDTKERHVEFIEFCIKNYED